MPKTTGLDKQWQQLMTLCENEAKMREEGNHPRLLRLIASDIETLGASPAASSAPSATAITSSR
jgi:hypothetical protein